MDLNIFEVQNFIYKHIVMLIFISASLKIKKKFYNYNIALTNQHKSH